MAIESGKIDQMLLELRSAAAVGRGKGESQPSPGANVDFAKALNAYGVALVSTYP